MDRLKNLTPILIFIAVLTFLSVGFAVYKAVTAFSGTVESPRYDSRSPIEDIGSVPFKLSRLEGQTQAPRLADEQMVAVYSGSQEVARVISRGKENLSDLPGVMTNLGMSSERAGSSTRNISRGWPVGSDISGEVDFTDNGEESSWLTVSSDYVVVNDFFDYGQGGSLDTGTLQISWVVRNGRPLLDGVQIEW